MSDGFPSRYMQSHLIPLSTEEAILQQRRACGDSSVTVEMIEVASAQNIRAYLRGQEDKANEAQVRLMIKHFGPLWNSSYPR